VNISLTNNPISHYSSQGIQKGILLQKYVELVKEHIDSLKSSESLENLKRFYQVFEDQVYNSFVRDRNLMDNLRELETLISKRRRGYVPTDYQNANPNNNPEGNQNVNPEGNLNANPEGNQNVNPEGNLNANPEGNQNANPDDIQNTIQNCLIM